ncbi:hypothetical protein AVEN_269552-1 [Araneus ventricosus]|uniref:Uncharacterized protein n=1 Tax=Araneus ventricosus TaxID=182803 RepID=A0A4Y2CC16_ARAVE|nr:hypothetical protein AVEN_269552-1 [Araneus ventricosus]
MRPSTIKNLFTDSTGELYSWFVYGQLALLNKAILGMEKDNTTAFEVAEAHKRNLTKRKASNFIPMLAKNIYRNLDEQVRNSVKEEFDGFCERCIAYLDLWRIVLETLNSFHG